MQFLPTGILRLGAGERVESALLDAVHQLARLARGGNEVVPAASDVGVLVEREDVLGDGIAVVVVVKEPAVERGVAKGGLDLVEVHTDRISQAAELASSRPLRRTFAVCELAS